jgi:phage FluMu gp28-like protein
MFAAGTQIVFDLVWNSDYDISLDEVFDESRCRAERDAGRQLFAGVDVGRHKHRTVVTVVERVGNLHMVRAILRLDETRLPEQQQRLEAILSIPAVRILSMDSTGIGLGLFEYTANKFPDRVQGVNFASTVPLSSLSSFASVRAASSGSVRRTEVLATQLLQVYEDRAIHQPVDVVLRDDLRKPERLVSTSGRVSIAATRDEAGHADHFWSLALAIDAAKTLIPARLEWHAFVPKARVRCTTL